MLQVGYSMPPAAVPGVTSTKLYACYSKASAYDRPWRAANDILAVRLRSGLLHACEERRWHCRTFIINSAGGIPDCRGLRAVLCLCSPEASSAGA